MRAKPGQRNHLVPVLKAALDILTIHGAVLLSYYLRFYSPLAKWLGLVPWLPPPPVSMYLFFAWMACLVFLGAFALFRNYRSIHFCTFSEDIPVVLKTCFLGLLMTMSAAFFYRDFSYSRATLVLFYVNANFLFIVQRFLFQRWKRRILRGRLRLVRVALVGSEDLVPKLQAKLATPDQFHFQLVGYFTEQPLPGNQLPYLGRPKDLNLALQHMLLDGLLVAFHHEEHDRVVEVLRLCEGKNLEIYYFPDLLDYVTSRMATMELNGLPLLELKAFPISGWQGVAKRTFDVVFSLIGVALFSPLMLMIAMLVKLTSPGPVLYRQRRVSLDGREFTMLKFRTLRMEPGAGEGLIDVKPDDPRVTPLGRILRKSGLDELPQLFNVLRGHMSLVGPRPERPFYVEQYRQKIPLFDARHWERCGITGWAQVNGKRQSVPWEERIPYDLFYVQNWSMWFDVKILVLTILVLWNGRRVG